MSLFTSKPGMKGKAPESEASKIASRRAEKPRLKPATMWTGRLGLTYWVCTAPGTRTTWGYTPDLAYLHWIEQQGQQITQ